MPSGTLILIGFLVIGLYVGAEAGFVNLKPSSEATAGSTAPVESALSSILPSELLGIQESARTEEQVSSPPVSSPTPAPVVGLLAALTPAPPTEAPAQSTALPASATPDPPTPSLIPATATPILTATAVPATATAAPTLTPVPPTATLAPTLTPLPATATPIPTATPVPPTATLVPTATQVPPTSTPMPSTQPPSSTATPLPSGVLFGLATYYWDGLAGSDLGCTGGADGDQWVYDPLDATLIAVGPDHYEDWPCGTVLEVCGIVGCIEGERKDSCPGCGVNHLDLSRLGHLRVCGDSVDVCEVTIRKLN